MIRTCIIPLPPPPPWRPTPIVRGGFATLITPKPSREWRARAAPYVQNRAPARPYTDAVLVDLVVVVPRPKRLDKAPGGLLWAVKKPDVDNVAKTVLDTMTQARWWTDDDTVVGLTVHRFFAELDGEPRIEIRVRPAPSNVTKFGALFSVARAIFRCALPRTRQKRDTEARARGLDDKP